MPASWPAAVKVFTTKINITDKVDASHVNEIQDEVVSLQTYLGVNPQGGQATVSARIAAAETSAAHSHPYLALTGGTLTGALKVVAGSEALPGLSFSGDTDTGLYSSGVNQLAISTGGVQRILVGSAGNVTFTGAVHSSFGTAALPSITFDTDTDTGIFRKTANEIGFATAGTLKAHIDSNLVLASGVQLHTPDGSNTSPSHTFASDNDTGMYLSSTNTLAFSTGGVQRVTIGTNLVVNDGAIRAQDGTEALPGISFTSDGDTGIWRGAANNLDFVTGGVRRISVGTANVQMQNGALFRLQDGTSGAPALSFVSDTDLGLYRDSADLMGLAGKLTFNTSDQTNALIRARGGDAVEFGHTNSAGYASVLGHSSPSGLPWLVFSGEAGSAGDKVTTIGKRASVFRGDLAGGFVFSNVANASGVDQTPSTLFAMKENGQLTGQNGTAALPTYSFTGDTNTGVFWAISDALDIAAGGAQVGRFRNAGGDGFLELQAAGTGADDDTYLYFRKGDGVLGGYLQWDRNLDTNGGFTFHDSVSTKNVLQSRMTSGELRLGDSAVDVVPAISGSQKLGTSSLPWQSVFTSNGSASAPAHAFGSDPDTGTYLVTTGEIGFASGGAKIVGIDGTGLKMGANTLSFLADGGDTFVIKESGIAGRDQLRIADDSEVTGILMNGPNDSNPNRFTFETGGVFRLSLDSNGIDARDQVVHSLANGTSGAPAISFESDADNGLYWYGANILGVSQNLWVNGGTAWVSGPTGASVIVNPTTGTAEVDLRPGTNAADKSQIRWRGPNGIGRFVVQADDASNRMDFYAYTNSGSYSGQPMRINLSNGATAGNIQVLFIDGTESLPGFGFLSDIDTGFYRKSTNTIGVTGRLDVDTGNGAVGPTRDAVDYTATQISGTVTIDFVALNKPVVTRLVGGNCDTVTVNIPDAGSTLYGGTFVLHLRSNLGPWNFGSTAFNVQVGGVAVSNSIVYWGNSNKPTQVEASAWTTYVFTQVDIGNATTRVRVDASSAVGGL